MMLGRKEYDKKQLVLLFANHGERLSFKNDNLVISDRDGNVKHQSTCYRILAIFVIGNITITSGLIQRAKRFCFSIVLMNQNLRTYDVLGFKLESNTVLRKAQYTLSDDEKLSIASSIVSNKIDNQRRALMRQRNRGEEANLAIARLKTAASEALDAKDIASLMGVEGSAAKIYFKHHFNNCAWKGRKPRAKIDFVNVTMDIGYTIMFNYLEALLVLYGFDVYKGALHQEFYHRKSLVCDVIEPFRPLIDLCIRKAISLRQCIESDFECSNGEW